MVNTRTAFTTLDAFNTLNKSRDIKYFKKKYNWIDGDSEFKINEKKLIKIIYSDKIVTDAQLIMHAYDLDMCIFFYCDIKNDQVDRYTYNIEYKRPYSVKKLYKLYLEYQYTNMRKILQQYRLSGKRTRLQKTTTDLIIPKNNFAEKIDYKNFVSASRLKNFVFKDTLCDWLDEFNTETKAVDPQKDKFYEVFQNGVQFEKLIISSIEAQFPKCCTYISSRVEHSLEVSKFYDTVIAMKKGIPIIFHGVLHNNINNTFGVPDILIRCDHINKVFPGSFSGEETENVFGQKHYRVIDIKSSTLKFHSDGETIINSPMTKFYKTQICLYNIALGIIQGFTPSKAYILGNAQYDECASEFKKLAIIDYDKDSFIIDLYTSAVSWIQYMRRYGKDWDPKTPHISELLPNLKNEYDNKWTGYKRDLVRKNSDITELWNCSTVNRLEAFNNGITCWRTQSCSPRELGFVNDTKTSKILDLMIRINKTDSMLPDVYPEIITNNFKNWQARQGSQGSQGSQGHHEVFLDFESIISDAYVFMIGVGMEIGGQWRFVQFTIKELNDKSEKKLFKELFEFLHGFHNLKIYHWGNFEKSTFENKCKKYNLERDLVQLNLIDMLQIFKEEPILIRGALNFGLKPIAKNLYKLGHIETIWKSDLDGFSVSTDAKRIFREGVSLKKMKNISAYNEIDCRVLWEILLFLRSRAT